MRVVVVALLLLASPAVAQDYVKRPTRQETVRATLASFGLPTLESKWHHVGPFDSPDGAGFDAAFPPEKGPVDLAAKYVGKRGARIGWQPFAKPPVGTVIDLMALYPGTRTDAACYLYTEFESPKAFVLPLSLGSDDTLSVWVNGKRILHENHSRAAAPDQDRVDASIEAGKNTLLVKVCQAAGEWAVYVHPEAPPALPATVRGRIDRDFPPAAVLTSIDNTAAAEATYYPLDTFTPPEDCVLEVGGLAFRPDGTLVACTRRGEVWTITNPTAADPKRATFRRFATGLHEALGVYAPDDRTLYVVHRPEIAKLTDADGDGRADGFESVCDKWGVSGDYHEYAFGPAVDRTGKMFVTLNVGFGGGHQGKAAWRGWLVRADPATGMMEPWATGLRSPNGVTFAPDGELFYADNQGEWVATNKLHHLRKGKFYGHQAGLKWLKDSPFAGTLSDKPASGMTYDGQSYPGLDKTVPRPAVEPPAVWFPYGRMGQSASEPKWDTTAGKFGPFAGQCFVGDQTRSCVMRVAMEKVNGVYQGACFPFRSGLQCGVNRLAFGPDGALYAGQTNRGWGSVGGKPYGLQRLKFAGRVPTEVHHLSLTNAGFEFTFTKPVTAKPDAVAVKSFTYVYHSSYGSPEVDPRAEPATGTKLSADGRTLSVGVAGLKPGRVYEFRLDGVTGRDGEPLLHPDAYYTLNELRR